MNAAGSVQSTSLTDEQFDAVGQLIYSVTGIRLGPTKRYFVDKRVARAMSRSGATSFDRWWPGISRRSGRTMLQELINDLTVNETYFLREAHQFESLVENVLPRWLEQSGGRPLRIWSLPCSTGEEPYSIAMTLLESWPALSTVDVEIVASDINTTVLEAAQSGVYGERSLQRVPADLRRRYFRPVAGGRMQIASELREVIQFVPVNLSDAAAVARMGPFDVVFCRNLLIYFDAAAREAAVQHISDAMHPGGHLYLGHSESMSRISDIFETVQFPKSIAYRRPAG